jgi:hypothetical protein
MPSIGLAAAQTVTQAGAEASQHLAQCKCFQKWPGAGWNDLHPADRRDRHAQ